MFLENETELFRFLQRLHLGSNPLAETLVGDLRNQVFNFGHADKSCIRSRANQPCLMTVSVGFLVPEIKVGRTYLRLTTGTSEGPTKERFQRAPGGARIERCLSFEVSEVSL